MPRVCAVEGTDGELRAVLDPRSMGLRIWCPNGDVIWLDVRGCLHRASAVHLVTRCDGSKLRTRSDGRFQLTAAQERGSDTISEAVRKVASDRALSSERSSERGGCRAA